MESETIYGTTSNGKEIGGCGSAGAHMTLPVEMIWELRVFFGPDCFHLAALTVPLERKASPRLLHTHFLHREKMENMPH